MKSRAGSVAGIIYFVFLAVSFLTGILLYTAFLGYQPGLNMSDLLYHVSGISPFLFFGITAVFLISFPVVLAALAVYGRYRGTYYSLMAGNAAVHFSDRAIAGFVRGAASLEPGAEAEGAIVDIFKGHELGIRLWIGVHGKWDYIDLSEKVRKRVVEGLESSFGINRIRYFHIILESAAVEKAAPAAGVKKII